MTKEPRPASSALRIGSLVEATLAQLGIAEKVERAEAVGNWAELVGEHIARVARPVRVRGSTLFVEVDGAAWLMELNLLRPTLLNKLNAGRSRGRVEKIVFLQSEGRPESSSGT